MAARLTDFSVREALYDAVRAEHLSEPDTLVLGELGLRHGASRVDLAAVNGLLHGYEIKSDADTLERLPGQVAIYSAVLDRVTLVVGERHWAKAAALVPEWWGVVTAHGEPGAVTFVHRRPGKANTQHHARAVAELLWREEALATLRAASGSTRGLSGKPRAAVYDALASRLPLDDLRAAVRAALKARDSWRANPRPE